MGRGQLVYTQQLSQAFLVLLVALPVFIPKCAATQGSMENRSFEIQNDTFIKNGQPLQIISGRHVTRDAVPVQVPELHEITLAASLMPAWLLQLPLL